MRQFPVFDTVQMKKVMVAMSGGIDSAVAAWLMKENGCDCVGAMMKLYSYPICKTTDSHEGAPVESRFIEDNHAEEDARAAANLIGIPFKTIDFTDVFASHVISQFISGYKRGTTPNPCVDCNKHIKFGCLLDCALNSGCAYISTGHYAQVESVNGRYLLKRGADRSKDQSYVLYTLTQDKLAHIFFPLGSLTKTEVRELAIERGFSNVNRRESQDICFLPNGNYAKFIEEYADSNSSRKARGPSHYVDESHGTAPVCCDARESLPEDESLPKPGRFIDYIGNDLGMHRGIHHYTVGQRRGLGISSAYSLFVCAIDPENNTVILGPNERLFSNELYARSINLISLAKIDASIKVAAKIRYNQPEQKATIWQLDEDTLRVEFDEAQRAITRGQAVVLYDGDTVVGGGTIF